MKVLETQICLDLRNGQESIVSVQPGINVYQYFRSLDILNKSAHVYGAVYRPSIGALELLESLAGN